MSSASGFFAQNYFHFHESAHRSSRRCLITESMMKTNCLCEQQPLAFDTGKRDCETRSSVLVSRILLVRLKSSRRCKNTPHRHKLSAAIIFWGRAPLPKRAPAQLLLLMCTEIKEEKRSMDFCFPFASSPGALLFEACLALANEFPYRVTRFILEYHVSIKRGERKTTKYLYISLLALLGFVHLRCDSAFGLSY
jgi:hypothetical protein